jgi:hypothetical protein
VRADYGSTVVDKEHTDVQVLVVNRDAVRKAVVANLGESLSVAGIANSLNGLAVTLKVYGGGERHCGSSCWLVSIVYHTKSSLSTMRVDMCGLRAGWVNLENYLLEPIRAVTHGMLPMTRACTCA